MDWIGFPPCSAQYGYHLQCRKKRCLAQVRAVKQKLLRQLKVNTFERLHDSDLRISKEVIQTVLRNVGEL